MSNYSEGTQVPFGDGSHVPPEEMTDDVFETDTTMETAMKNIFLSCDPSNSNSALVSDLINFMTPHMQEHISELTMLKKALDPSDTDPHVDSETFYKVMLKWTSQFMEESDIADSDHNTSVGASNDVKEKGLLYGSSLSRTGVGQRFLKGYIESDSMNLSNSSTYSCTGNSGTDVTALQEKINELEHQNRKLIEELEHSRTQVTNSEEQNEALQADVKRITRRLLAEQQTNGQLEKDRQNIEELVEASAAAQKQISKLEKDLSSAEKQVSKLKQEIRDLEIENQKFEDRIDQLVRRDTESKQLIQKFEAELHAKEQEITSLGETQAQMSVKLNEQKQLVSHYLNVNKSLKEDKLKMEKHYRETIKSRILTGHLERVSQTFSDSFQSSKPGTLKNPTILNPEKESLNQSQKNSVASVNTSPIYKERQFHSPLAKLYKNKGFIFNSPRLLNMVANPVSPHLDNSTITSSASCKKSVDSDVSPVLLCSKNEPDSVLTCRSSTPEESKKTLLDQTPPSVVRKLPLLSPTHKYRQKNTSHTNKKDMALFRQYRFVGSSSSEDEELNYQTAEFPEIDLLSAPQIKQEYDANLNIITHLEGQKETLLLLSNEEEKKESSLPTMYVVEHSLARPRSKSASSSNPSSIKSVADISYEDDPFLWKLVQNVSPHESLENEISQAKLLDNENAELRNTLHHLEKENNRLKAQISSSIEKVKNYSPERREQCETEFRALKVKIQDLESDNNHKYIKIIDLMEEKEKLVKELKRVNGKDTDDINKLKQNISELHHEKSTILRELQQVKWEKENCDSVVKQLQSVKHECDLLQNLLQRSKQNREDLIKELDKVSIEKCELRAKIDKLKKSMCEVNEKNSELNIKLQNISDEYVKLKKIIKIRPTKETASLTTHDNMNSELSKPMKKNEELTCEQSCRSQVEKIKSLKNVIAEDKSTIESLMEKITDLSAISSRLSQNATEKENQIAALKQIINHQNESLKVVTTDKETSTTRLYEQKSENDRLYQNNKELTKSNHELVKQIEHLENEKEYLCVRLNNLEEENKSILAEFKIITGDYKTMKDSDNNLVKEYKLLLTEKELLTKSNEQLTNDYKKMKELKEEIEQQLLNVKNEAMDESNVKQHSASKVGSPKRQSKEIHDYNKHIKELHSIRQKLAELENTNKLLQSENEKLQGDFHIMRSSYESLANEKEMWLGEKNECQQLKDELSKKLMAAMAESKLLEEQLNNSNKASQVSLIKNEDSCSNCLLLNTEIEDLNARLHELQEQNSKKIPFRRYDKMQVTIEKLKNKTYGVEEQLKSEKEKTAKLESENCKLKAEVQENWKNYTKENAILVIENSRLQKDVQENLNHYEMEKVDLTAKLSTFEEQLKKLQNDLQEVQQEKTCILQDCNNLKEKLEAAVKEKENRLKFINKETNQLKQEIQELIKQKNKLEKKLEKSENLLKCRLNVDKINKENSHLKQEMEEANKQVTDFKEKLENAEQDLKEKQKIIDSRASVAKENLDIKQQMEDLEKKLEKSQHDLKKAEAKNISIRKDLIDMQTTRDDVAVESSNCRSVEKHLEENDRLQKQVNKYEGELIEIKIKLNDSSNCLHSLVEHVQDINQKLNEKRKRLHCSTVTAVTNWRAILEEPDKKSLLEVFDRGEPATPQQVFIGPLDEEMFKFQDQIHVTCLILDSLGNWKASPVSMTSSRDAETQVAPVLPLSFPQKYVKKFTSKTKTDSSRSVSPDSPPQKGKLGSTDLKSKSASGSPLQNREASPTNKAKLHCSVRPDTPAKNIKPQSTDTSFLRRENTSQVPIQNRETSPVNKPKKYVSSDSSCYCASDVNRYFKSAQDDDAEDSMPSEDDASFIQEVEMGLLTNKNFPSLSDSTLESLGLLYEGDSPNWSKKETEEKFHILVTCFMMDIGTIKERYKKQQNQHSKIENRFCSESKKVVAALKDIKKLDKDHQIKVLVTTCLRQVKQIVWMCTQISTLAMQCGALQHEQHSLKIINVMINHAANLRQVVENNTPRLKSISTSASSPKHRKPHDIFVHSSNSSSLQLKEVPSVYELSNDYQQLPDACFNNAEEKNDFNRVSASISCGLNSEVKKYKDQHNSRIGIGGVIQKMLFYLLLFLALVVAVVLIGFECTSNGISVRGYPWHEVSWNEIFAPFVKRTYTQGPPPT